MAFYLCDKAQYIDFHQAGKSSSRMNFGISFNTVLKLRELIQNFQPNLGYQNYAKDIKEGIKFTKKVSQKDYLLKLIARNESTPEIQNLAIRNLYHQPIGRNRNKKEERKIMLLRVKDKEREIVEQRKK